MADDRRPARGGHPRGRTGPGRTPGAGRAGRAPSRPAPAVPPRAAARPGTRPTGRLVILVVVVSLLAVASASYLRAYFTQRSELADVQAEIAERQQHIDELAREKRRWDDDAYIEQQARERLNYVMPGETVYVALDENGEPLEAEAELSDPATVDPAEPEAWWADAWGSVELAGDPPAPGDPVPLTEIDGSKEGSGE